MSWALKTQSVFLLPRGFKNEKGFRRLGGREAKILFPSQETSLSKEKPGSKKNTIFEPHKIVESRLLISWYLTICFDMTLICHHGNSAVAKVPSPLHTSSYSSCHVPIFRALNTNKVQGEAAEELSPLQWKTHQPVGSPFRYRAPPPRLVDARSWSSSRPSGNSNWIWKSCGSKDCLVDTAFKLILHLWSCNDSWSHQDRLAKSLKHL